MKRTLFIKTRTITSLVVFLMTLPMWGNDGDTFTENTVGGVMLTYTVISEAEKTCMVGEKYNWPVPTARANRVHKVSGSQLSGDITIPEVANGYAVIYIEAFAFERAAITSVVIPNSVKALGIGAFAGCADLKSVRLSNQLTKIEAETFFNCANLTSIDIPEGVTSIGDEAFAECISLESIVIPNSVTSIGVYAFALCKNLTSLSIGSGVKEILWAAFLECTKLSDVFYYAEEVPYTAQLTFDKSTIGVATLHVPAASVSAYQAVEPWKKFKEIVALPARDASILCDGRSWKYEYSETDWESLTEEQKLNGDYQSLGRVTYNYWLRVEGNELFDGRQCKKIVYDGFNGTGLYGYGYEDDGRVMVYALKDEPAFCAQFPTEQWVMLYDFNVAKDSHCDMGAFWTRDLIVSVEGTVKVGDVDKRFIGLSDAQHPTWPLRYAVDGVGCSSGLYEFENIIDNGSSSRFVGCYDGDVCIFSAENFNALTTPKDDYRPFIEDGKVWKVGAVNSGNPVQCVEYYYFDCDTIIGGKTCKKMMCQRYVSPDFSDDYWTSKPSLSYVGAWYEEDKKVYLCQEKSQYMYLMYDFSLEANDTLILTDYHPLFIIGPKQTGGIEGFKGVYRDIMICGGEGQDIYSTTWLEGIGGIDGPTRNVYPETEYDPTFLMACYVGDEVIYLNDEYEDGATPEEVVGARKDRIDFTHTIKIKPKSRTAREAEAKSLYGEYNSQQLGINLNALDEAYLVSITDEAGKAVYEKTVNAGSIVGLNIDISAYAEGRYTVTVENDNESFTGEIDTRATGISDAERLNDNGEMINDNIYNLQGQRISSLRKGLNIVSGRKVFVK